MRRLARGSCRSVEGMRSRGDDKRIGRTVKESSRDGERMRARAREPTSEVALWPDFGGENPNGAGWLSHSGRTLVAPKERGSIAIGEHCYCDRDCHPCCSLCSSSCCSCYSWLLVLLLTRWLHLAAPGCNWPLQFTLPLFTIHYALFTIQTLVTSMTSMTSIKHLPSFPSAPSHELS